MAGGEHQEKPISLFYSYSHSDEELRKLENHLAALRWSGLISEWHDRNIDLGDEWAKEIDRNLSSADIILLLVSANFIASQYCWSVEMKKALERHDKGEAKVIPVILRPCAWHITPFAKLQAAPTDAKPVTVWSDPHSALFDVANKIERVVKELRSKRAAAAVPAPAVPAAAPVSVTGTPASADTARSAAIKIADLAVFRDVDAPWCPEMVALPAGEFLMGSPESEKGRFGAESPQHRVTIGRRFALGRYPVTVGEYRRFIEASGHRHEGGMYVWTGSEWKQDKAKSWRDPGFAQTDRHPVVGVRWRDAAEYSEWLGSETGKPYRLVSEAEWEYACRAGPTTRYSFGDAITPKDANYAESKLGKTTEVGAYAANRWGLRDMHGNVSEWVEDIWHDNYKDAPTDGSAWIDGEGIQSSRNRVFRGGSWDSYPWYLRSANRGRSEPGYRVSGLGFRVARRLGL